MPAESVEVDALAQAISCYEDIGAEGAIKDRQRRVGLPRVEDSWVFA
jgi:hypothetical protein